MVVEAPGCGQPRVGDTPARVPVAAEFAIGGDLRFLSHHDELRMLMRALVRAGWPLAYSQGFNPRPHLVIPLPRNVGTAADSQLALVDLRRPAPAAMLSEQLSAQLPADYRLRCVRVPAPGRIPQPEAVEFVLEVDPPDRSGLGPRVAALKAMQSVVVRREYGPGRAARLIDIRPFIDRVEWEGCCLRFTLRYVQQRTARPSEVTAALGLLPAACNHRLRRTTVHWQTERPEEELAAAQERNHFDDQEDVPKENNSS